MRTFRQPHRKQNGSRSLVDSPMFMFVVFLFLAYPLLNLVTVGLRSMILSGAVQAAAIQGGKCMTYMETDPPHVGAYVVGKLPAIVAVKESLNRSLSTRKGVKIVRGDVGIVVVRNSDGSVSGPFYAPLKKGTIDAFKNVYYLDVEVVGEADPLFNIAHAADNFQHPERNAIPGLTGPFILKAHSRQVFENPQGLCI